MQMANWMPNVYPWKVAILAIFAKMANFCQRSGHSIWRAKVLPWRVAISAKLATLANMAKFGKNGEYGTNGKKSPDQRVGDIKNVADIQIGCQAVP